MWYRLFEFNYRMILTDYDEDFFGGEGFFEIKCNENTYGEIYAPELNDVLFKDCIFDWFVRMLRACILLSKHDVVYISDTDSYAYWIKIEKVTPHYLNVNSVKMEKWEGSHEIELINKTDCVETWKNSLVTEDEFRNEMIKKSRAYLQELKNCNPQGHEKVNELEKLVESLEYDFSQFGCFGG